MTQKEMANREVGDEQTVLDEVAVYTLLRPPYGILTRATLR